jgi:hypothetical protein
MRQEPGDSLWLQAKSSWFPIFFPLELFCPLFTVIVRSILWLDNNLVVQFCRLQKLITLQSPERSPTPWRTKSVMKRF